MKKLVKTQLLLGQQHANESNTKKEDENEESVLDRSVQIFGNDP